MEFRTPSKEDLTKFCLELANQNRKEQGSSSAHSNFSGSTDAQRSGSQHGMSDEDFDSAFNDFLANEQETLAAVISKSMGSLSSNNSSDLNNSASSLNVNSNFSNNISPDILEDDIDSVGDDIDSESGYSNPMARFAVTTNDSEADMSSHESDLQVVRQRSSYSESVDVGSREVSSYEFGDRYIDVSSFTGSVSTDEINATPEQNYNYEPGVFNFNGTGFNYTSERKDITHGVSSFSEQTTPEDTFLSYQEFMNSFTEQLISHFGSLDRIGSFLLKDGLVIVNQCAFTPQIGDKVVSLPEDVRIEVEQQNYRWLINYSILKKMPNVQFLSFEDIGFVNLKVRKDLGVAYGFSHTYFFKHCKNLQCLELGGRVYNRSDYSTQENVFELHDRIEDTMNSISSSMLSKSVWCWGKLRDVYTNPDRSGLSKAMGIVVGTPLSVAGGLLTGGLGLGAKAANLGRKGAHGIKNFLGTVKNNF